jgi:hypothetical protein
MRVCLACGVEPSSSPTAGLRRLLRPGEAKASVGTDGVAALDDEQHSSKLIDPLSLPRSRALTLPSADLTEDSALAAEEIRARVTLIPLPAPSPTMESNTVQLDEPPKREQLV